MPQSLAEKYREHRFVMEHALRWKCTPKAAKERLRAEESRRRREEIDARLKALQDAPVTPGMLLADQEMAQERALPYWKQGDLA